MLSGTALLLVTTTVLVGAMRAPATPSAPKATQGGTVRITVPGTTIPAPSPVETARTPGGCGLSLDAGASIAPVGSCTVLEIGDSLGNDLGWGLARELPAGSGLTLVQLDKSATGLAASGYYDWPAQLAADVARYKPQLVLICVGGNDEQGMEVDGAPVQFPTPSWQRAYLARAEELVTEATAGGGYAMWVGLPVMEDPGYSQGVEILDSLYAQAVRSSPRATFVSSRWVFAGPRGVFQSNAVVDGAPEALREPDGIHLTLTGEDVLATYIVSQMASIYHVELAAVRPEVVTAW